MKNELIILVAVLLINVYSRQAKNYLLDVAPQLFEEYIEHYHKHYIDNFDKGKHFRAFLNTLKHFTNFSDYNEQLFELNEFADFVEDDTDDIFSDESAKDMGPFYFTTLEQNPHNLRSPVEIKIKNIQKKIRRLPEDNNKCLLKKPSPGQITKRELDLQRAPKLFKKYVKDFNKTYTSKRDKSQHYKAFLQTIKDMIKIMDGADDDESVFLNQSADELEKDEVSTDDEALDEILTYKFKPIKDTTAQDDILTYKFKPIKDTAAQYKIPTYKFKPIKDKRKPFYNLEDAQTLFEVYTKKYTDFYEDDDIKRIHFDTFNNNLKDVHYFNQNHKSSIYDMNEHTDYTPEQQWKYTRLYNPNSKWKIQHRSGQIKKRYEDDDYDDDYTYYYEY